VRREHTAIVIMASTAASVAVAMEVIAALGKTTSEILNHLCNFDYRMTDLFYNLRLNSAVAVFSIFATQMLGEFT
jgi:hypothetical protein